MSFITPTPSHFLSLPLVFSVIINKIHLGCFVTNSSPRWMCAPSLLKTHRETDRFLEGSGVQLPQTNFHFRREVFSSQIKSTTGNILGKTESLRIYLNIDGTPIPSRSHSPITQSKLSTINLVSIFRCSSSPRNPVHVRRVDPSVLAFSLSLYRHPHICIPFSSRFICSS